MFKQSLNGSWQLEQIDGDLRAPATVPGCVHTDLLAADLIPDPFLRDNELDVMWIGENDWRYRRTFYVSAELLNEEVVLLCYEGLDTLAAISMNGQSVVETDNMFRRWEIDVKPLLHAGENEIEVRFASALKYGQACLAERYIHSWSTDSHKLLGGNWLRKEQCNFGWDWGPKLVTCGIWRDINLLGLSTARLSDVYVHQEHGADAVTLNCSIAADEIYATASGKLRARVSMSLGSEIAGETEATLTDGVGEATITIKDPQLWWPRDLGDQPLYVTGTTPVRATPTSGTCGTDSSPSSFIAAAYIGSTASSVFSPSPSRAPSTPSLCPKIVT